MTAEEFTDTVFSKIDVNGDGEAALGVPRGGVTGGVPRVPRGEGRRGDGGTKGPLLATSSACLRPGHRAGFWGCLHQTLVSGFLASPIHSHFL